MDDKVLGLYAGGMTVRDISAHLSELHGVQIGRDTISRVTDAVLDDVAATLGGALIGTGTFSVTRPRHDASAPTALDEPRLAPSRLPQLPAAALQQRAAAVPDVQVARR